MARKHLGWYAKDRPEAAFRSVVNRAENLAEAQLRLTRDYFDALVAVSHRGSRSRPGVEPPPRRM